MNYIIQPEFNYQWSFFVQYVNFFICYSVCFALLVLFNGHCELNGNNHFDCQLFCVHILVYLVFCLNFWWWSAKKHTSYSLQSVFLTDKINKANSWSSYSQGLLCTSMCSFIVIFRNVLTRFTSPRVFLIVFGSSWFVTHQSSRWKRFRNFCIRILFKFMPDFIYFFIDRINSKCHNVLGGTFTMRFISLIVIFRSASTSNLRLKSASTSIVLSSKQK